MNNITQSFRNPLRVILNTTIFVFILLLIIYVSIRVAITYDTDYKRVDLLRSVAEDIRLLSLSVFQFVRPFLQLVIILVILEWLLNKFGLSLKRDSMRLDWNVQTIIALVVIIAFALAALSGVEGAGMLKDVALVVVGFYFGTQKKTVELVDGDRKSLIIDEHNNERTE